MNLLHLTGLLALPILALLSTSPTALASADESTELRALLNRHVIAMGGWKNLNSIESIQLNGTIERDGSIMDLCIVKKKPNQIRATITVPAPGTTDAYVQMIRAHDGTHAWSAVRTAGQHEFKRTPLPTDQAQELLSDASIYPKLIQLWKLGAEIAFSEQQPEDPTLVSLDAHPQSSETRYIFTLDRASAQTVQFLSIRKDGTRLLTQLGDYQIIEGVHIPFQSVLTDEQSGMTTIRTHSAHIGVGIYEEYFAEFTD
ncbi:hypothetical protein [Coraliomargarita akajimensis]|uniref:Uncharacterized protein n=1 Tax=Coraliomargarita akajimensis (strain DSM 45221 / IAM 15411 / JCM 23193 / KCTC 12865 / 04OKA010-24) TaxID=583355 RepID=D5EMP1_CORAD|nr:hypothetical protein [Coraliomargarita akajimensis]ADE55281.1 hypothetical protein Caka_2264 [Coraliomargarita akajimensis DSM 45221]